MPVKVSTGESSDAPVASCQAVKQSSVGQIQSLDIYNLMPKTWNHGGPANQNWLAGVRAGKSNCQANDPPDGMSLCPEVLSWVGSNYIDTKTDSESNLVLDVGLSIYTRFSEYVLLYTLTVTDTSVLAAVWCMGYQAHHWDTYGKHWFLFTTPLHSRKRSESCQFSDRSHIFIGLHVRATLSIRSDGCGRAALSYGESGLNPLTSDDIWRRSLLRILLIMPLIQYPCSDWKARILRLINYNKILGKHFLCR